MTTFGYQKTVTVVAAQTAGIAALQSPPGAGALTLVSNPVVLPGTGQRISLTSAADLSARTFTFVGISYEGIAETFTTTGPNVTTKILALGLKSVTSVSVDAATGANVSIGWAAEADVPFCTMDLKQNPTLISYMGVIMSGAPVFTGQYTLEDIWDTFGVTRLDPSAWVWFNDANMTAKAATADSVITKPITALRLYVNGVGTVRLVVWQAMNPGGGR